jgi:hypothetical protein
MPFRGIEGCEEDILLARASIEMFETARIEFKKTRKKRR